MQHSSNNGIGSSKFPLASHLCIYRQRQQGDLKTASSPVDLSMLATYLTRDSPTSRWLILWSTLVISPIDSHNTPVNLGRVARRGMPSPEERRTMFEEILESCSNRHNQATNTLRVVGGFRLMSSLRLSIVSCKTEM